jgi:hypothetical protein
MYIQELASGDHIDVEVILASLKDMPMKKDGWNFNWRSTIRSKGGQTFVLRERFNSSIVHGVLQLKIYEGMMIMDMIEIAPHNIGSKRKKYDRVAGILIAFACRESFKLDSDYKGFLTFQSKTLLIELYQEKYGARLALGQRMYIEPEVGLNLINEYLQDEKE